MIPACAGGRGRRLATRNALSGRRFASWTMRSVVLLLAVFVRGCAAGDCQCQSEMGDPVLCPGWSPVFGAACRCVWQHSRNMGQGFSTCAEMVDENLCEQGYSTQINACCGSSCCASHGHSPHDHSQHDHTPHTHSPHTHSPRTFSPRRRSSRSTEAAR